MDDEQRREVNRANAKKSTGPRSAAGKARSAMNSTRHGLLANRVLLDGENEEELKLLRDGMRSSLRPVGELEEELAERMIASVWRKRRGDRVELGLWDWRGTVSSGQSTLANVFFMDSQHDQSLQKLTRYMTAASGEFRRAFQMLKEAQDARRTQEDDEGWVDEEATEVERGRDDSVGVKDPDGGAGGAPPAGPTAEAQAAEFALGPDWVTQADCAASKREVAPRDPSGEAKPEAPPRRSWEQMTAAERALFSVRNHDRVMAFDDMLQEALANRQWMERLGFRDLLRVSESFNSTMWQTMRSIDELLKEDEPIAERGNGH
jgi:hypothetical protein